MSDGVVVLARYAPVRTVLILSVCAAASFAVLFAPWTRGEGVISYWLARPVSAVVSLPLAGAWTWMWGTVLFWFVSKRGAAIIRSGDRFETPFWGVKVDAIEGVDTERGEDWDSIVVRLKSGRRKRVPALRLEGDKGQISVRLAKEIERVQRA